MPENEGLAPEGQGGGEGLAPGAGNQPTVDEWADLPPLPEGEDMFPRSAVEDLRNREAKYRIRARDLNQKVEQWGGEDRVAEALKLQALLDTDDGVTALFLEAGQALGLNASQIEALFHPETQLTPEQREAQEAELDQVVTVRDAQKMVEDALRERVLQPQQEREAAELRARTNDIIETELKTLGAAEDDWPLILKAGEKHIADGDFDPAHIRAAVRAGEADFKAAMQRAAAAYLQTKEGDANGTVAPVGGGSPGGEPPSEPQSVEEAKAIIRQQLKSGTGAFGGGGANR